MQKLKNGLSGIIRAKNEGRFLSSFKELCQRGNGYAIRCVRE